ncbi:nitrous oxide reductase accessory protein NosL [Halorientalis halophila]|uniref:nitrous oxide reductase accessory protein NosL n=1 Tax=Halorientalis halophila TaxID=3108499 RepID=UPI0030098015
MCDNHVQSAAGSDETDGYLRRTVLGGMGAVGVAALAGCSGIREGDGDGTADVPAAVTLTADDGCEVCGMVIPNHPGPSAEIFYPDERPEGHDNPARFDSTWEAFQYDFEKQEEGWERSVVYVTDYSSVDYQVSTGDGQPVISTHPEASAFARAATVTFVADSEVEGAMGRDLIAFGDEADASSFRDEYGGQLVTVEEVTSRLIQQLGR